MAQNDKEKAAAKPGKGPAVSPDLVELQRAGEENVKAHPDQIPYFKSLGWVEVE